MVGQLSLLQMSFREVASKFSYSTNCRTCSYFQLLRSTVGGLSMILCMLAESLPRWCELATNEFLDVLLDGEGTCHFFDVFDFPGPQFAVFAADAVSSQILHCLNYIIECQKIGLCDVCLIVKVNHHHALSLFLSKSPVSKLVALELMVHLA